MNEVYVYLYFSACVLCILSFYLLLNLIFRSKITNKLRKEYSNYVIIKEFILRKRTSAVMLVKWTYGIATPILWNLNGDSTRRQLFNARGPGFKNG
jgi:hypothetical protein